MVVFHAATVHDESAGARRGESGRVFGWRARALRRVPHASEFPRRSESKQIASWRKISEGRTPNLTPIRLKKWNDRDLREFLRSDATPEGDVPADAMYEVMRNTSSQLNSQDVDSLIVYIRSLPPLPDEPK